MAASAAVSREASGPCSGARSKIRAIRGKFIQVVLTRSGFLIGSRRLGEISVGSKADLFEEGSCPRRRRRKRPPPDESRGHPTGEIAGPMFTSRRPERERDPGRSRPGTRPGPIGRLLPTRARRDLGPRGPSGDVLRMAS